jgi:quinol-cytochrome oxidoreductase complex cytochrome b subunit
MADSKDFVAGIDSNAKKSPRRIVFITRRTSAQVKADTEDQLQTFPEVLFRAAVAIMTLATALVWIALIFNAPLEGLADPSHTPNPAKAPWYFLGLQEMVSYSAFWGGIGIPGLMVALLIAVPYLDRNPRGVGRWFAKERLLANTLFLALVVLNVIFIIIGTFFRGPNWTLVSPF